MTESKYDRLGFANLTDTQRVVIDDITTKFKNLCVRYNRVWLNVSRQKWQGMRGNDLKILSAPAPGGAWRVCGNGVVHPDRVELNLYTVWDIMARKPVSDVRCFLFCDPMFPNNLYDLLKIVAVNAERAHSLQHRRSWQRYHRRNRNACSSS